MMERVFCHHGETSSDCTLRCKVVVAGAPTVGKTSLCQMTQSSGSLFPKKYNMV